ncbi:MAG: beta strand repeat-containing protein, partial [Bacteroidia bacterium]
MISIRNFLLIFALFSVSFGTAQTRLVGYPGYNAAVSTFPIAANYTSSEVSSASLNYGGTGITPANDNRTVWSINNTNPFDASTSPYLEYEINFTSEMDINFDRFVLHAAANLGTTTATFELRWSIDNYASSLGTFTNNNSSYKLTSVDLSSQNSVTASQITFRIYIYGGTLSYYNPSGGSYASPDGTPSSYDNSSSPVGVWTSSITPPPLPPTITSIAPATAEVGDSVIISGTNFDTTSANNIVYFGGIKATVTSATSTQLTVTVPQHSSHAPISVNVNGLSSNSSLSFSVSNSTISSSNVDNNSFENQVVFSSVSGRYTTLGSYATDKLIAVADFDGDNKIDIAKAGSSGSVSVHLNTSTSQGVVDSNSFDSGTSFNVSGGSWSIEIADIDGDGKLDIISSDGSTISILRNTSSGPGNLSFDTNVALSLSPASNLDIFDVDSDGKLDLVVSGSYASYFKVKLNTSSQGIISFDSSEYQFSGASGSRHFTSGDLDNDGKSEVILLGSNSYIFKNNSTVGAPSFSLDATISSYSFNSVVADFDGDGDNDILGSGGDLIENIDPTQVTLSSYSVTNIASANIGYLWGNVGDYNGDGKVDYSYGYRNSGTRVNFMLNDISGGTITGSALLNYSKYGQGLGDPIFVDVDGDNKLDIVTSGHQNSAFYILRNRIGEDPTIVSTSNFSTFDSCLSTSSTAQTFTVEGNNLTANISITAPSGFEISSDGSNFSSSLQLTHSAGTVSQTTIYARLTGTTVGSFSGNISLTSTGATSISEAISGTVNAPPTLTATSDTVFIDDTLDITASTTAAVTNAWISSNPSVMTVNSSGVVSGVADGTATITFTDINGCTETLDLISRADFTCAEVDQRNNGNGQASSCPGVSGTAVADDVIGTSYNVAPNSAKTGSIRFRWTIAPSVIPVITSVWLDGIQSAAEVGPPSIVSTTGGYEMVTYCFYNVNLPNAGSYTLEFSNPQTGEVYGRCTFTGNSDTPTTEPTLVSNTDPTITSSVTDQSSCANVGLTGLSFTISDAEDTSDLLLVSASSSNQTLVTDAGITITHSNDS